MSKHEGAHKYIKRKLGSGTYQVWKCMLPGCTHYIKDELAENRMTVCWRCSKELVLDKVAMELTRPHCRVCTRGKRKQEEVVLDASIDLLAQLFGQGDKAS